MSVTGFVDDVSAGFIAGWSTASRVVLSVNGRDRATLTCDDVRPDVCSAGLSPDGRVGFAVRLDLLPGDIVRVRTREGLALGHSPWLYLETGQIALPSSLVREHPEYAELASLLEIMPFEEFRPVFGQNGQSVTGALLYRTGQPTLMVRLGVGRAEHEDLKHLHDLILGPCDIAAPALLDCLAVNERWIHVHAFQEGKTLSRLGPDWGLWAPAILEQLQLLQQAGERQRGRLGRRRGRRKSGCGRLLRDALLVALRRRAGASELAFLVKLMGIVGRLPRVLSHGDLHWENVLVDPENGELALIDWDRWGYLPVGFDAALLLRAGRDFQALRCLDEQVMPYRLGVLVFSYLLRYCDLPDFHGSGDGRVLRQWIRDAQ
ncbi:phosphotransferase [Halomonas sp. THAF12]|uniref:phosphotransferase n=1 Tax=Halomonas sp. B23F22_10 TaxID=3459515 RepID=UPI00373E0793